MKKAVSVLVMTALLTSLVVFPSCGKVTVEIPDHDLEIMIRKAIEKPEGDLFQWELEELTVLRAGRNDVLTTQGTADMIYDLTGLEYCTGLEFLDLTKNGVVDLTPLGSLTKLKTLFLTDNGIRDIEPLSHCTALETLDISGNQITDISPLAPCTGMIELYIGKNRIQDIEAIAGMENLIIFHSGHYLSPTRLITNTEFPGSSNRITDISPLAELTMLEDLNLNANEITDLSPLTGLKRLTRLCFNTNYVYDISPLAGLTRLIDLDLGYNDIADLSPLRGLVYLERLCQFSGLPLKWVDESRSVLEDISTAGVSISWSGNPDLAY